AARNRKQSTTSIAAGLVAVLHCIICPHDFVAVGLLLYGLVFFYPLGSGVANRSRCLVKARKLMGATAVGSRENELMASSGERLLSHPSFCHLVVNAVISAVIDHCDYEYRAVILVEACFLCSFGLFLSS
ncbi:unnamed protein product, partial [Ectocarpus sp. 12 AP-2014]